MTQPARPRPLPARGTTLIEAIVALAILLIGLVGTMQLQVLGVTSNAGARSHTQALQLARELAAALEQLGPDDALIGEHFDAETPPAEFGHLVTGPSSIASTGYTAYADSLGLRGVTTDAQILATSGKDPIENVPRYQRRWQVWQMTTAATSGGVKAIAVSVTYREPKFPGLREVVLLTQVANRGASFSFAAAYR